MSGKLSMQEPTFFTLAALVDGPLHGYAIIGRAHELSGRRVRLAAGTLYAALDRLTEAGREALRAEAARMQSAARTVLRRLAAQP